MKRLPPLFLRMWDESRPGPTGGSPSGLTRAAHPLALCCAGNRLRPCQVFGDQCRSCSPDFIIEGQFLSPAANELFGKYPFAARACTASASPIYRVLAEPSLSSRSWSYKHLGATKTVGPVAHRRAPISPWRRPTHPSSARPWTKCANGQFRIPKLRHHHEGQRVITSPAWPFSN
jgi:hypothetical protein